jgi:hypothetical protein
LKRKRQSNTLLGLKDISAVLNHGEVIKAIIGRGGLGVYMFRTAFLGL